MTLFLEGLPHCPQLYFSTRAQQHQPLCFTTQVLFLKSVTTLCAMECMSGSKVSLPSPCGSTTVILSLWVPAPVGLQISCLPYRSPQQHHFRSEVATRRFHTWASSTRGAVFEACLNRKAEAVQPSPPCSPLTAAAPAALPLCSANCCSAAFPACCPSPPSSADCCSSLCSCK